MCKYTPKVRRHGGIGGSFCNLCAKEGGTKHEQDTVAEAPVDLTQHNCTNAGAPSRIIVYAACARGAVAESNCRTHP
jgi:hypothetical protein